MGLSASTSRVIVRKYQDEGIIFESKADKEIRLNAERPANSTPPQEEVLPPNEPMLFYPPPMHPYMGYWAPNYGWNPMGLLL